MDEPSIKAQAEAYWTRHVEPVMKQLVIDAVMAGASMKSKALADWFAAMPVDRAVAAGVVEAGAADPQGGATAVGQDTAFPETAKADQASEASRQAEVSETADTSASEPVGPVARRPLQGLSKATYEIVMRTGRPMTSRELLNALREREGGKKSAERDNTLLASMRRCRKANVIAWDGTHYAPMPAEATEASEHVSAGPSTA